MIAALNISSIKRRVVQPVVIFIAAYLLLAGFALNDYLPFASLRFITGLVALLFVLHNEHKGERSFRYAWFAGLFFVLCLLLPVITFLYFTISFSLLFLVEYCWGKTSTLPAIVIILISPLFKYAADTFSFPIRLQLTNWAASAFALMGSDTVSKGNAIIHQGQEYFVDPGCMGLNMMETSLLFGIIILSVKQVRHWFLYLSCIILLNLIANYFRILGLVQFDIKPGTIGHDIVGLLCLFVYVILPAIALTKYLPKKKGNTIPINYSFTKRDGLIHSAIFGGILLMAIYVSGSDTYPAIKEKQVEGYAASICAPGILKLKNDKSLVYIKYIRGFYDTDHNPMICWKGSGYAFESVERAGDKYSAKLVNGNDIMYTAWWFSNGTANTASQLTWRWNMLSKKERYALVNVTCSTKEELDEAIKNIEKNLYEIITNR